MTFNDMLQDWASAVAQYEASRKPQVDWKEITRRPVCDAAKSLQAHLTDEWKNSNMLAQEWGHVRSYTYKKLLQLESHGLVKRRGKGNLTEWKIA